MKKTFLLLLFAFLLLNKPIFAEVSDSLIEDTAEPMESDVTDNTMEDENQLYGITNDNTLDKMQGESQIDHDVDVHFNHEEDEPVATHPEDHCPEIDSNSLNPSDPNDHLTKFHSISMRLKTYEKSYKACFDDLHDNHFSKSEIDKCTGPDFAHVDNALDYERRKVVSWADKTINRDFVEYCYKIAAQDKLQAKACDILKNDVLLLLWNDMPMHSLIVMHKRKYLTRYTKMNPDIFQVMLQKIAETEAEFDSLHTEVELHREMTIEYLKKYIKDRVSSIMDRFNRGEYKKYPRIREDLILITEVLSDTPDYDLDLNNKHRKLVGGIIEKNEESGLKNVPEKRKEPNRSFQPFFVSDWNRPVPKYLQEKYKIDFKNPPSLRSKDNLVKTSGRNRQLKKDRFDYFTKS